ncbi:MAG: EF-P lysine aminoacylase GenX [Lentisphaerae bacterium]|nr:EF-P lysine aminoacylase GenX [Lentisphaerota bacterium]
MTPRPEGPGADHPLALRSRMLAALRAFFAGRGFVEVETPVRVAAPALETHIDAEPSGDRWLRTSPELHMKRLLARGWPRLFQMGPCFRRGERGELHHPEYTMLEWYRAPGDAAAILGDLRALLPEAALAACGRPAARRGGIEIPLDGPWEILTVADAFRRWAGWDPVEAFDADRFDLDLVDRVEPALPRDRPVVLTEYPAAAAALARLKPSDPRVAERWEAYLGGVELANAYSELTDPAEQRARFEACAAGRRARNRDVYPLDESFLSTLARMPPAGGAALGVDRLAMLLAGADSLDAVMAFRE